MKKYITIPLIGLMMWMGGTMLKECALEKRIEKLEKSQVIHTENVIGTNKPEVFYEIKGQKVYLKIDEVPVEQYFTK